MIYAALIFFLIGTPLSIFLLCYIIYTRRTETYPYSSTGTNPGHEPGGNYVSPEINIGYTPPDVEGVTISPERSVSPMVNSETLRNLRKKR